LILGIAAANQEKIDYLVKQLDIAASNAR
jgi:hypothetical protein